jgi:lipid-A-disaccharide synthase
MKFTWNSERQKTIFISAGEVSGDRAGAYLAAALRRGDPKIRLCGAGGDRMRRAGVELLIETNHLGSVGLMEPLTTLPELVRTFYSIAIHLRRRKMDVVVLIGHDLFHVVLARYLRVKKIPTIAYFPPQVWLWRKLAGPIGRSFDCILTSFQEEQRVYQSTNSQVTFVGHYLCDLLGKVTARARNDARKRLGQEPQGLTVGILPGSRTHEIQTLLPVCLETAREMLRRDPSIRFVIAIADARFEKKVNQAIRRFKLEASVQLGPDSETVMTASDLVLACSGTATLEATLLGVPMIILYKVSPLTYRAVRFLGMTGFIESETIGLPNLLAERMIVPELRQNAVSPSDLAKEAWSLLTEEPRRTRLKEDLDEVSRMLGEKGSVERAARLILNRVPDHMATV